MTDLNQCMDCGHGGWNSHELKQGLCPSCYENENGEYSDYDENDECCEESVG
jgi:hypothetical protein